MDEWIMSNRAYDRYLEREYIRGEYACCECGYLRNMAHHPKIRCPKTGRCGSCGNDWPCADHAPKEELEKVARRAASEGPKGTSQAVV